MYSATIRRANSSEPLRTCLHLRVPRSQMPMEQGLPYSPLTGLRLRRGSSQRCLVSDVPKKQGPR
jgi:hypothetical protein